MDKEQTDKNENQPGSPLRGLLFWVLGIVFVFAVFAFGSNFLGRAANEIPISKVFELAKSGGIAELEFFAENGHIKGKYKNTGLPIKGRKKFFVSDILPEDYARNLAPLLREKNVKLKNTAPSVLSELLPTMLFTVMILALIYFFFARQMRSGGSGGILSFGKSRAVRVNQDKHKKTFEDVAGIDEAREEVEEIISFLRNPEKFQRLGGRLPKGVLLVGPPGTGKTLLAKAIAGEADVPFFSISGSDFVEMFVGVGASRVRDLFEQAKEHSPCIIFLDEIDAVGRKRANDLPGSGVETAQTLNAILVEMDGFTSDDNVIVVSATNRADVLDPALLRPGRFDRRIYVDLPDVKGRKEILHVHSKKVKMNDDVDLDVVARITPAFSGADLENMVNEAALMAAMLDYNDVNMACFEEARDKVRFGKEKRSRVMDEEDRHSTAVHEAGHALLMKFIPHATPLHKVTIIPRGRALGATMQLPDKDEYSMSRRKIFGEIAVLLGGRAAEELFLEDISNGASSDLEHATTLVRMMICEWGMSEELGLVRYADRGGSESSFFESREFSEATAEKIDTEIRRVMDEQYERAKKVLKEHEDDLQLLVEGLLEFEVLDREQITRLLEDRSLDRVRKEQKEKEERSKENVVVTEDTEDTEETAESKDPVLEPDLGTPPPLPGGA